jgi:hypothetical protein
MTQEIKACKDCKHYRPSMTTGWCEVVGISYFDYDVGKTKWCTVPISTYKQRSPLGRCREQASLFEPKPTLLQKIKNLFVKEKT